MDQCLFEMCRFFRNGEYIGTFEVPYRIEAWSEFGRRREAMILITESNGLSYKYIGRLITDINGDFECQYHCNSSMPIGHWVALDE